MKLKTMLAALAMGLCTLLGAQTTSEEFNARYQRQVNRLGYAGVGVEGILDKWEAAFPEDGLMLEARFNYFLVKSVRSEVVKKDCKKWLGADPVLSIPDSTGAKVNYFEEQFFDEELLATALGFIDRAIELYPDELMYRVDRTCAMLSYEKESPDLSLEELMALADRHKAESPKWTISGTQIEEADFIHLMAEFCVRLYNIGTPSGYEAFRTLSEKLNRMWPKEAVFLNNLGSYWLVAKGKDKKAASYYKKALKLDPESDVAKMNLQLIERRKAAAKKGK